jgi:hypothetical protein
MFIALATDYAIITFFLWSIKQFSCQLITCHSKISKQSWAYKHGSMISSVHMNLQIIDQWRKCLNSTKQWRILFFKKGVNFIRVILHWTWEVFRKFFLRYIYRIFFCKIYILRALMKKSSTCKIVQLTIKTEYIYTKKVSWDWLGTCSIKHYRPVMYGLPKKIVCLSMPGDTSLLWKLSVSYELWVHHVL